MIVLKKIQLVNFLSHQKTELSFSPSDKLLIDGVSGSGKSSIIDALVWCIFGVARSGNKNLIQRGKTAASVVLVVEKDGEEFKIKRDINNHGKHEVTVAKKTGERFLPVKIVGVRAVQEYIEKELFDSSYLLFVNSICQVQDPVDSFIKQTAVKRKEILLEIAHAAKYDAFYETASKLLKERETAHTETSLKLAELVGCIKELLIDPTEAAKLKTLKDKAELLITSLGGRLLEAEREAQVALEDKMKRQALEREKGDKIAEEKKLRFLMGSGLELDEVSLSNLKEADREMSERWKEKIEWQEKYHLHRKKQPADAGYLAAEITAANKILINLICEPVVDCPELKKPCPRIEERKRREIAEATERLESLTKLQKECTGLFTIWEEEGKKIGAIPEHNELKHEQIKEKIRNIAESVAQKAHLPEQIAVCVKRIEEITVEFAAIPQHAPTNAVELLKAEIDGVKTGRAEINARLEQIARSEEKIAVLRAEAIEIEKTLSAVGKDLEALALAKEAFGSKGVKTIVVDYVLPALEDRINAILGKLSGFRVHLETQKEGSAEGTVVEGLFINIINEKGEEMDFSNYSGGEKIKVNLAISEGLASLQKIGFRVLDESIVALDAGSVDDFCGIMEVALKDENQYIVISHLPQIKELFSKSVLITKQDGVSSVR